MLARPGSTEEVAAILRFAGQHRLGVVPYAGGTGLVGGQTGQGPASILLSVERMDAVRALDPADGTMIAEAGLILADVHKAAGSVDRMFPLALASGGSARIGGLLATNAGGVQVLRYGNARALCLGLEAVLPDGSVLHGLTRLHKDNTGYDLRDLLIGAEGTLGVITAACLRLFPQPAEEATALVAVPGPEAALALLTRARAVLGETLSAFELIARQSLIFLAEAGIDLPMPFDSPTPWMVLIQAGGGHGSAVAARAEQALTDALAAGEATDAVVAQNARQAADFWEMRERIPEANRKIGAVASHDIAVPVSSVPAFIAAGEARVAAVDPALRINAFGHLGDGNLHYNVFPPAGGDRAAFSHRRTAATAAVHGLVREMGGSISAEHGIGRLKAAELAATGDPGKLAAMRAIKRALDPMGIMNPGAVLSPRT
ncbi:MAG: FAD-binding oxidoreductase [Pseudomonadota bacterium]